MGIKREEILELKDLVIGYRSAKNNNILLPPVSACAMIGELIAVIGENGIGKSTLLRTITGLQPPLGGEVFIKGLPLGEYQKRVLALKMGYISTEPVRVENMSVQELVSLGRYPHTDWAGRFEENDHKAVLEAIDKVGLRTLSDRNINEISDGERQRAMIARVLAQDSDILVMDEPTAFLDIRSRFEIVHLLHHLSKNRKKTIIFSTHDFSVAAGECDKIWLATRESFIEGAPEDLILNGKINDLFNGSVVKFNSRNGNFSFQRELRGTVKLEADGIEREWTVKALNRAGFGLSNDQTGIYVTVTGKRSEKKWTIIEDEVITEFFTIYDFVNWLNNR